MNRSKRKGAISARSWGIRPGAHPFTTGRRGGGEKEKGSVEARQRREERTRNESATQKKLGKKRRWKKKRAAETVRIIFITESSCQNYLTPRTSESQSPTKQRVLFSEKKGEIKEALHINSEGRRDGVERFRERQARGSNLRVFLRRRSLPC